MDNHWIDKDHSEAMAEWNKHLNPRDWQGKGEILRDFNIGDYEIGIDYASDSDDYDGYDWC